MDRFTAMLNNITRYNTGAPCMRGHNSDRYSSNGGCVECLKGHANKYKSRHSIFKIIEVRVHPSDVDAIKAYVEALHIQRKIILDEEFKQALAADSFGRPR